MARILPSDWLEDLIRGRRRGRRGADRTFLLVRRAVLTTLASRSVSSSFGGGLSFLRGSLSRTASSDGGPLRGRLASGCKGGTGLLSL